jgi:radical SAM superfamily enzyme YgiQ (UPF0313 family)
VRTFDTNVSKRPYEELKEIIEDFSPAVIGISLRNIDSTNKRKVTFYYSYLKDIIDIIKKTSDARIVIGGSGFSMFANEIMKDELRIDYGVFLEGENTFKELLDNIKRPEKVKGIFYRSNGNVLFTGPRMQADLNALPFADRTAFGIGHYCNIPDAIGVETKRGCMLDCIYCIYGFLNGKKLRIREPKLVVDEIESLVRIGVRNFTFVDAVYNIPISYAEAVCREMIKRDLDVSWSAWFHEDFMTEEFVTLIKTAGCNKIILSPDGFSDGVLQKLGKTIKKKDILRVFDMLKDTEGIEICYNFFKSPPWQDLSAFLSLFGFYFNAKLRLKDRVHFEFNSIRIEPHTRLYEIALEEGLIGKEDNLLYPKYYTNSSGLYIERIFNTILRLKGK